MKTFNAGAAVGAPAHFNGAGMFLSVGSSEASDGVAG